MSKKTVFFILIVVVLISTASIIFSVSMYMENGGKTNEKKSSKTYSLELEDIYCDIKDSKKIVKINITIETYNKDTLELLSSKKYLIRNNINEIVRNKTEDELKGKDGQVNLQNDIKENLVKTFNDQSIINIYFNDFVIQ